MILVLIWLSVYHCVKEINTVGQKRLVFQWVSGYFHRWCDIFFDLLPTFPKGGHLLKHQHLHKELVFAQASDTILPYVGNLIMSWTNATGESRHSSEAVPGNSRLNMKKMEISEETWGSLIWTNKCLHSSFAAAAINSVGRSGFEEDPFLQRNSQNVDGRPEIFLCQEIFPPPPPLLIPLPPNND